MGTTSFPHLWENILGEIDEVCCDYDRSWRRRVRIIDTKLIVSFIFQIVLSQNSCGYATALFELWSCFRARGERPKKLKPVAASSMCEARQKLDENIFKVINSRLVKSYENRIPAIDSLWHGRRIFAVDGSKILLPLELFSQGFNISSTDPRCPQGLASCLYNIKTKLPYDFTLVEHGDERLAASEHLEYLMPGDCVVYDRGYFGYVFLLQHKKKEIDAVFRISDGPVFQPIREFMDDPLEPSEKIVTILPSESTKKDIKKRYKDIEIVPIELRIIRYRIGEATYFLATTLTSDEFTTKIFPDLYHSRWGVEEFYKIVKSHIKVEDFHSKTVRGVKQELFASIVIAFLTRIMTLAAEVKLEIQSKTEDSPIPPTPKKKKIFVAQIMKKHQEKFK